MRRYENTMRDRMRRIRNELGGIAVRIGEKLMTERRQWPNAAREDRDKAAEAACRGIRTLDPLVSGDDVTDADRARRVGLAHSLFQLIARILEGQGAQTKP